MEKPTYYRECLISARGSDWDVQEEDEKFIAILVPAQHDYIAEGYGVDIPEHWEIWNAGVGTNEILGSDWIVTKWKYIIEDMFEKIIRES